MEPIRVIISGGGTGGHIFPAISIANAIKLRYPDAHILFVGAKNRMEMEKVPLAGYEIIGLEIAGFNRKNLLKNISVLWKLRKSISQAKKIIRQFEPQIAIGVGGYASGPTLNAANKMEIPTLLLEQNSFAGVTNKILGKKATTICVGYENMDKFFPKEKIVMTGTACRQDLSSPNLNKEEADKFFNLDPLKKTILIVGGSLGAKTMNESILTHLDNISSSGVQIIWQCGNYYHKEIKERLAQAGKIDNLQLHDFINRMDLAYKTSDLVISRAGAGAIAELCLLSKPTILVPSPNVAEDHQTHNAMALVTKEAAILVKDIEAKDTLIDTAINTVKDDTLLQVLATNISKLAQHDSANRIVDEAIKIINKK